MTQCQLPQYWSFLLHVLFIRVYGDKDSNAMRINNCSLVGCKRKEKGFSDNPPFQKNETKQKQNHQMPFMPNIPLAFFEGDIHKMI